MVRTGGKELPSHWVYVPSRRQVRDLLRSIGADVRRVEFGGTGSGHGSVGVLLGYVERRVASGAWTFYLRLWGVPVTDLSGRGTELAQAALAAIGTSVAECAASPAADDQADAGSSPVRDRRRRGDFSGQRGTCRTVLVLVRNMVGRSGRHLMPAQEESRPKRRLSASWKRSAGGKGRSRSERRRHSENTKRPDQAAQVVIEQLAQH